MAATVRHPGAGPIPAGKSGQLYFYFGVRSMEMTPEEISRHLAIEPDKSFAIGQLAKPGFPGRAKINGWSKYAPDWDRVGLADQLERLRPLLREIAPRADALRDRCDLWVKCAGKLPQRTFRLEISSGILSDIARTGATLGLDVTINPEGPEDDLVKADLGLPNLRHVLVHLESSTLSPEMIEELVGVPRDPAWARLGGWTRATPLTDYFDELYGAAADLLKAVAPDSEKARAIGRSCSVRITEEKWNREEKLESWSDFEAWWEPPLLATLVELNATLGFICHFHDGVAVPELSSSSGAEPRPNV